MVKSSFEVVAGTYEEFLLGYNFSSEEGFLTQSFAAHDHAASVRCVAVSEPYLASGGADDRIIVYDMKARKEHCTLTHHNATVNCLQFTGNHTHLISGSSDGVLAIVRVGSWQLEKIWDNPHKGAAVLDIAVHSSGKLALTLGADGTLCTWNLVKGRQAYIINLNTKCKDVKSLEKVVWAPDEVRFVLYGGKYTEIWSIESGGVLKQIEHKEKVTSCAWRKESLLVGHEDGQITVLNIENNSRNVIKAHVTRVKSIAVHKKRVISVSSDGCIKIWNKKFEELAKVDTGCRLTCLSIVPSINVKNEDVVVEEAATVERPVRKQEVKAYVIEETEEEIEKVPMNHKKRSSSEKGAKKKKRKN